MKFFKPNKQYNTVALYVAVFILFTALCVFAAVYCGELLGFAGRLVSILRPVIYGFLFAYLASPLLVFNERHIAPLTDGAFGKRFPARPRPRLRRALAILLTVLIILAFVALFVAIVVPSVAESYTEFSAKGSSYLNAAKRWLTGFFDDNPTLVYFFGEQNREIPTDIFSPSLPVPPLVFHTIDEAEQSAAIQELISASKSSSAALAARLISSATSALGGLIGDVAPGLLSFIVNSVSEAMNVFVGIVIMIYVLLTKERLRTRAGGVIRALFGEKTSSRLFDSLHFVHSFSSGYFSGRILGSLIIGVVCWLLFLLFGLPFAPLIALVMAVMNFVPYIGLVLGGLAGIILLLFAAPGKIIFLILSLVAVQQLDSRVIEPRLLHAVNYLTPEWIIVAIVVCWGLFGALGMFFAVPLFTLLFYLIRRIIARRAEKAHARDEQ